MNLYARQAAANLASKIESRADESDVVHSMHELVDALGGVHYQLQDMTPEGRLLYILALHLRQSA